MNMTCNDQHSPNLYVYKGRVERVVDGDTLDLVVDLGFGISYKIRVRLAGIDAPETYGVKRDSREYAAGKRAADRVRELVEGREVIVETEYDKKGKFGRYVANVYLDDVGSLNELLVREGLAKSL